MAPLIKHHGRLKSGNPSEVLDPQGKTEDKLERMDMNSKPERQEQPSEIEGEPKGHKTFDSLSPDRKAIEQKKLKHLI